MSASQLFSRLTQVLCKIRPYPIYGMKGATVEVRVSYSMYGGCRTGDSSICDLILEDKISFLRAFLDNYKALGLLSSNNQIWQFETARSRLYRSRFLWPNTHFSAFFMFYKICKPLHRSKCKIHRFSQFFCKFLGNSLDFIKIFWNLSFFTRIFTDFDRNFGKCLQI